MPVHGGGGGGGGGGSVTEVDTGAGLTGGPITTAGSIAIADTAVTPGTYTNTNLTVNNLGQITAAANGTSSGTGTVTQVNSGTGLTGGPITTTGTLSLGNTAVTPGTYTSANITVDSHGRLTAAANGAGGTGTVTQVNTGTGLTGGPVTTTGTVALANTAVTAGIYTSANITVDAQGRITSASNGGDGTVQSVGISSSNLSITGTNPITGIGTIGVNMPNSGVSPGSYTHANITVDSQGRITTASNGTSGSGTVTQVSTGTGLTGGPINTVGTIALANTAVTAGTYANANITVDAQGRLTAASAGGLGTAATKAASNNGLATVASVVTPTTNNGVAYFADTNGTLTSGAPLGQAAFKGVTNNTYDDVPTVIGPVTIGNYAVYTDTIGTIGNGGIPATIPSFTGVVYNTTGTLSQATSLEITNAIEMNPFGDLNITVTPTDIVLDGTSAQTLLIGRTNPGQKLWMPSSVSGTPYAAQRPYMLMMLPRDGAPGDIFQPIALVNYLGSPILDGNGDNVVMQKGDTWMVFFQPGVSQDRAYRISSLPDAGIITATYSPLTGGAFSPVSINIPYAITANPIQTFITYYIPQLSVTLSADTAVQIADIPSSLFAALGMVQSTLVDPGTGTLQAGSLTVGTRTGTGAIYIGKDLTAASFTSGSSIVVNAFVLTVPL